MTLTPRYSPSGPPLVIEPPVGGFDPIFRQRYLDTTKPDGGNGSIGAPYNTWADAMSPIQFSGGSAPWVIALAQGIDASGTPIPNVQADGHNTGRVKLQGPIQQGSFANFENSGVVVSGLVVDTQQGNDFALNVVDLTVIGVTLPTLSSFVLTAENAILSSFFEGGGSVFGDSLLIDCALTSLSLPSWNLRMQGGTVDSTIEVDNGFLNDVEFFSSADVRVATSLNLNNCRFQAGAVLRFSANQQLNLDLTSWGSMVAAGVTFPDTFPQMTITPWVPVIGTIAVIGTTSIDPGGVESVDIGVIAPQEAEASTACIVNFATAVNSKLTVVGASINASRHVIVLISNNDVAPVDLIDPTYTITYLPRLSP